MHSPLPTVYLLQDGASTPATELTSSQTGAPGTSAPLGAPSFLSGSFVPLLIVAALFFFMLILPERKKQKQRQKMLDALKKGDRVMTTSGIHGTVVSTTSEVAVVQVADNVRLRFSRAAVQSVIEPEKDALAEKSMAEKSEDKAEPSKV